MVCKLLLFVVDVKVVVAVVVVAVFFWLGQVHHVKKKKKRQQQLWNAISLLRLVAVSFAAVISLSVHQKGFNSRLLVCLFALVCALFTVLLAVCFLNFQFSILSEVLQNLLFGIALRCLFGIHGNFVNNQLHGINKYMGQQHLSLCVVAAVVVDL